MVTAATAAAATARTCGRSTRMPGPIVLAIVRPLRYWPLAPDGRARFTASIGRLTSVHVEVTAPLLTGEAIWRVDPAIAGGGLFFDLGSHCVDLVDFLCGPITRVAGFALNTAGAYAVEDVTVAAFSTASGVAGTGIWNFNAPGKTDVMTFVGSEGTLRTPIFSDTDVVVTRGSDVRVYDIRNPPHVHQPLIQSIVNELRGHGRCESTAESGARASWVLEQCVTDYYSSRGPAAAHPPGGGHAPVEG